MFRSLLKAYLRNLDGSTPSSETTVVCPSSLMDKIFKSGHTATNRDNLASCAPMVLAFVFQVLSVSMNHLQSKDVMINETEVTVAIFGRKGRSFRRPLLLSYHTFPSWPPNNPISLLHKCISCFNEPSATIHPSLDAIMQH